MKLRLVVVFALSTTLLSIVPGTAVPGPMTGQEAPSAGKIVFSSNRDGDFEIYIMDADGTDVRKLTRNRRNDYTPALSPDGQQVAYVSEMKDFDQEIFIKKIDRTGKIRVTRFNTYDQDPDWSPDGTMLAFEMDSLDGSDAVVMRIGSHRPRALLWQQENSSNGYPTWSPDGRKIVALAYYDRGDLRKARLCCGYKSPGRWVTDDGPRELYPDWSPDGEWILFGRNDENFPTQTGPTFEDHDLFVVRPDGTGLTRLEDELSDSLPGSWSPSGDQIVFFSDREDSYDIFVMNSDATGIVRLLDWPSSELTPDWGP